MHLKSHQRKRGENQTILDYRLYMHHGIYLFYFVFIFYLIELGCVNMGWAILRWHGLCAQSSNESSYLYCLYGFKALHH